MFNAYKLDTVYLIRKTGSLSYGEKATTRTAVKARVEGKNIIARNSSGEQAIVSLQVLLDETTLTVADKIEVEGVVHPIVSITKLRSFNRVHGLEVLLG